MKFSLVPRLLELPGEVKVAICSAIFFFLCVGGWAVTKIPLNESPETAESKGEKDDQLGDRLGSESARWEHSLFSKGLTQRPVGKAFNETTAKPNPNLPRVKHSEPAESSGTAASEKPVTPEKPVTQKPVTPEKPVEAPVEREEPAGLTEAKAPVKSVRAETAGPVASRGERVGTVIEGLASFYGGSDNLDGCPTASGEIFDSTALTAAHRELPFGTRLRVTSLRTGKSVVVRVNDRGPFNYRLVLDLSRAAAAEIGLVSAGIGPVKIEVLD